MKIIKAASKKLEKIYNRGQLRQLRVEEKVRKIIDDVRLLGDDALIKYTRKFDKVKLSQRQLKVSQIEISGAYANISPHFVSSLKVVIENVNRFYRKQLRKSWRIKGTEGVVLGENYTPLEKVGVYIPAGTAPLVSTVYMTVLPAKLAGVKKIVLISPPDKNGYINPHILVIADLLKVDEIYRVGGAQGIAALAYGTKTIPRVDKIVGPGNIYVSEAKRQVFGLVDIDMIAGPTELVVIANRFSDPKFIVADLGAQGEHAKGLAILITNSKSLAKEVKSQMDGHNGFIILTKNLKQAAEIANKIAPEHLEILVQNPQKLLKDIKNAGAIFLGPYSPVALGDYVAGPSHVLPTSGTARFFSGLNVTDFIKSSHIISYSKKALEKIREPLEKIAGIEGLQKHVDSVKARFIQ
ncbi:MAG: histidinol dehydrogenase [Candidatus Omnitrophica bacterium]|nr:histidinol dehydrogenase [Candidatus Omnitrophota bacterium]MBU4303140.1 histidinol dehydrogenase [Candidatus Omnitrophota bacterium]MBU4467171.1 histidinol dehydrogenase [Candidatus Omnitrophota bacterium]MCG2708282.1 histidinol dehydrogenase [Candidatus Omnitrophota bacterium]